MALTFRCVAEQLCNFPSVKLREVFNETMFGGNRNVHKFFCLIHYTQKQSRSDDYCLASSIVPTLKGAIGYTILTQQDKALKQLR